MEKIRSVGTIMLIFLISISLTLLLILPFVFADLIIQQDVTNTYEGCRVDRPKVQTVWLQNGTLTNIIFSWLEHAGASEPYNITIYNATPPPNIQSTAFHPNCRNNTVNSTGTSAWINVTMPSGCSLPNGNYSIMIHKGTSNNLLYDVKSDADLYVEGDMYSSTNSGASWSDMPEDFTFYLFGEVAPVADTDAPTVTLNLPADGAILENSSVTFNCSATDATGLANITLYHNATGWSAIETKNLTGIDNSTIFSKTISTEGNYTWNCYACDNVTTANCGFASTNFTFSIPEIFNLTIEDYGMEWVKLNWT